MVIRSLQHSAIVYNIHASITTILHSLEIKYTHCLYSTFIISYDWQIELKPDKPESAYIYVSRLPRWCEKRFHVNDANGREIYSSQRKQFEK